VIEFLSGAATLASVLIALGFGRFWRETGDRFFLLFAVAFVIFAVNRLLLTFLDDESEARTLVYLARAVAFAIIIAAIVDKNRPGAAPAD